MKFQVFLSATLLLLGLTVGCQSHNTPTAPGPADSLAQTAQNPPEQFDGSTHFLWGYYNCFADLQRGTISAVPSRNVDIHVNVAKPLTQNPGVSIAIQPGSTPATGYFIVNVTIKHPFPGSPKYTGFDVHGILLGNGSLDAGSGLKIAGSNDPQLLNPDGWTRWWNPTEFTTPGLFGYYPVVIKKLPPSGPPSATINAYKLFGDSLWPTATIDFYKTTNLTDANGRAIFRTTSAITRQYKLQFPVSGGPVVYFDYAVDASWEAPSVNPPVNLPPDFPINANSPEAFLVQPTVTSCTLAGTPYGGAGSGELDLSIELWDWQGWAATSYAGQVGSVKLYSPYVQFNAPQVQQADAIKYTVLTVKATGIPSTIGTVPVVIEIPSPGTSWKQGSQEAPTGQVAVYAVIDIDVGLMQCAADNNVICDDAVPVDLKSSVTGAVCMPYDPNDYYVFTVPTGSVMEGTITLDNFGYSDNDLMLYKGCPGDVIDMALNAGSSNEILNVGNLEKGFYYVDVLPGGSSGTDVQPYKLTLDIHQLNTTCTTDSDNDYTAAVSIGLQDSRTDSVCAGGDIRDWLKIHVPDSQVAGGSIYLDDKSTGDINIRIYDVYPGTATYWGTNAGTQDEMVSIPGLGPGDHFIEVYAQGVSPQGDRAYTLDTDLIASDYTCASGDGNDSYMTADPIGFTDQIEGTVCFPADPDWFLFVVPDNKAASGTITLSGKSTVDDDLYLYLDPSAAPVESSANEGITDEVITLEELDSGTYYIKACAHPSIGNGDQPYTLTVALTTKAVGNFDFKIHAFIIRRTDGTNPATTEDKVNQDVSWASTFYSTWKGSFTLVDITYINNTAWLAASTNEMAACDSIYGDTSGPINVYYVNSFTNLENAAAYSVMDCRYAYETHNYTYVVMSDSAYYSALAHELGHATGIFIDMYLLDYYTCSYLAQVFCPYPPNNSYCNSNDQNWGNLMYWAVDGWNSPSDYWLSDTNWQNPAKPIESQIENWTYFHINYPNNF